MSAKTVTYRLPPGAAADLRRAFSDPPGFAARVRVGTIARALDLARALTGAERVALLLANGGPPQGDPLSLTDADLASSSGVEQKGGLWRIPLRVPLLASGEGAARTFALLALEGGVVEAPGRVARQLSTLLVEDGLASAATLDPLSGLGTRQAFERSVAELTQAVRSGGAVLLADVDGLRALNANRGTAAGDELLATLGAAVRGEATRGFRYGGGELLAVLPSTDAAGAQACADRLRAVASAAGGTLSLGIACAPADADDVTALVFRADQALARAKADGGDRALRWTPSLRSLPRRDRLAGVFTGDPVRDAANVQALLESVAAVSRLAPLGETLTAIVDRCVALTGAERGLLLLREGDEGWSVEVARGVGGADLPTPTFAATLADAALTEGRAISRLSRGAEVISVSAELLGLQAVLCAPLLGEDVPRGVLYVDAAARVDRFDEATVAFFGALAAETATALRNAALYGRLLARAERLAADADARERKLAQVRQLWANDCMARAESGAGRYEGLLGSSEAMRALFVELEGLQGSDAAVVIEGESGTGKELAARAIHARSLRGSGPLVAVNCGALPEGLVESELFGHRKGAFTSAHYDHTGLIEEAHGGTLFLDEVGELELDAQAKLLRVLESGELRRVGDSARRTVDVRVIAATNRTLAAMVEDGEFREDLFYRLSVFQLRMPPLRERPADVAALAEHLLADLHDPPPVLSAEALEALVRAPWPGNVRQLRNVLERASALAKGGAIELEHLGPLGRGSDGPGFGPELFDLPFKEAKARFGELYAERITEEAGGSIPAAAKLAGVSRQTFYRLLGGKRPS